MAATDGTLVLGVLSGDRQAFAELYDRRARLVRAICLDATGDVETAAELTQEVFMRAFERLHSLNDPNRFGPWLVGICRHVCREWRRGKLRERRRVAALAASPRPGQQPNNTQDQISDVRRAIAKLPEKQRLALHAFYLQEQDVEQARTVLGLSRSGFYNLLCNARRSLRHHLQRRGSQK